MRMQTHAINFVPPAETNYAQMVADAMNAGERAEGWWDANKGEIKSWWDGLWAEKPAADNPSDPEAEKQAIADDFSARAARSQSTADNPYGSHPRAEEEAGAARAAHAAGSDSARSSAEAAHNARAAAKAAADDALTWKYLERRKEAGLPSMDEAELAKLVEEGNLQLYGE